MTTKAFAEWLVSIDAIEILLVEENIIYFFCTSETTVVRITKVAEKTNNILSIKTHEGKICFCLHNSNFQNFVDKWHGENKKGVPDLSWVTMKQMAKELKERNNLTFALVWMEESGQDNISLEASGSPTILCGMLSRGLNLAVKWADKKIDYTEPQ